MTLRNYLRGFVGRTKSRIRRRWRTLTKWFQRQLEAIRQRFSEDYQWDSWRASYGRIYKESLFLYRNRAVFREVISMYEHNAQLQSDGAFFWEWLVTTYGHYIVLGVGRELDRGPTAINLFQLMRKMAERPRIVSRARFMLHMKDSEDFVRKLNDQWFTENFGPGEYADPKLIQEDKAWLEKQCSHVVRYRHNMVAHRSPLTLNITVKQVHNAMDAIEEIIKKYHILFEGAGLVTVEPSIIHNWQRAFTYPWIPPHQP